MKDLSQHIEYLLLSHDCVIYPQLGAFVTKYVPSRWSSEEDLFLPPFRSVCFNGELKEGDNLFVTTLSKRYRVTQDDAGLMCAEYLEHIHQELAENGTMDLGSIGVFIQENPSDALTFVPNEAGVTSPDLYGLDAIPFAPLSGAGSSTQTSGRNENDSKQNVDDDNHITIRISRRLVNYVAAAAASIVLFFALSTPVQNMQSTDDGQMRSELFMPSNLMPAVATTNATCGVTTCDVSQMAEEDIAAAEPEVETPKAEPTGFAVVLASQVSMKNAEAFVARLRAEGYPAEVYTKGSMVRVIIPGFTTAEEVHAKIREMKAQSTKYKSAWTLKLD